MLALLSVPGTDEIHDEILEVYLPNLLDFDKETRTFNASDVFAGHTNERNAADSSLMSHRLQPPAQRILTWLRNS
jgi:hypothetical protein